MSLAENCREWAVIKGGGPVLRAYGLARRREPTIAPINDIPRELLGSLNLEYPANQVAAYLPITTVGNWPTAGTPVGEIDATLLTFKTMS